MSFVTCNTKHIVHCSRECEQQERGRERESESKYENDDESINNTLNSKDCKRRSVMATRNTTSYKLRWGAAKASGQPAAAIRGIKL